MDSDDDSFFDNPEFNFAKDEQDDNAFTKNKLDLVLFEKKLIEDKELSGFISTKISKNMKAGSIFLRMETTEELSLEKPGKNDTLKFQIKELNKMIQKEAEEKRRLKDQRNSFYSKKSKVKPIELAKNGMMLPSLPSTMRGPKDDFFTLRDEKESRERVKKTFTKLIFDLEVFSIDNEINKFTGLVLPFRIKLSSKIDLFRSCQLILDDYTFRASGKTKYSNIKKMNIESGKLEIFEKKIDLRGQISSSINVEHKLIAYYIPKNDFHNFNLIHQNISEIEKCKIRYEYLQKSDLFLSDFQNFFIIPNYRAVDYKKHKQDTTAEIENDNQIFLCCTKKTKMRVNISLDQVNLRKQDSSLNFVMTFDKRIIKDYCFLDAIIYRRIENRIDDQETQKSETICMVETFDLENKLPIKTQEDVVECVQKLDLTPIMGRYQSIKSYHVNVDFYITFYLSGLGLGFELELCESKLNFFRFDNDLSSMNFDEISNKFHQLEKKIAPYKSCILLPYVVLDLKSHLDPNGLYIGCGDDENELEEN